MFWVGNILQAHFQRTSIKLQFSFISLACAEFDDSLAFSGASSIPLCYVLFPTTLLHQLFFHPLSPHLAIYFLVYLSILLFPNSYIILFWEFYFLPFFVHVQTNVIYLTLLSLHLSVAMISELNMCMVQSLGTGQEHHVAVSEVYSQIS